jgi:hypothetical protein
MHVSMISAAQLPDEPNEVVKPLRTLSLPLQLLSQDFGVMLKSSASEGKLEMIEVVRAITRCIITHCSSVDISSIRSAARMSSMLVPQDKTRMGAFVTMILVKKPTFGDSPNAVSTHQPSSFRKALGVAYRSCCIPLLTSSSTPSFSWISTPL